MADRINMLGLLIDNLTTGEALECAEAYIQNQKPAYLEWVNLNQIILFKENERYRHIVERASLVLTDGKPVLWISRMLHTPLKERIGGTDFVLELCGLAAEKGYSVFLLGGAPGTVEKAVDNLLSSYPGLRIAGAYSPPYGFEKSAEETGKINVMLKNSHADILLVGVGSPKQDFFIEDNMAIYDIPLSIPIGSAIDMISGEVKMPPRWISNIGMAWFFRFCQEPKRLFKRYFVDSWKIVGYYFSFKKR